MKLFIALICILLLSCSPSRRTVWGSESTVNEGAFSREQAEQILGVLVGETRVGRGDGCIVYDRCWRFTASDPDAATGKPASIYAVVEAHNVAPEQVALRYASAVRKMGMKDTNRVAGVGDEAHLGESQTELWLSARKGKYTIDVHVMGTSRTTTLELVRVVGEVVAEL